MSGWTDVNLYPPCPKCMEKLISGKSPVPGENPEPMGVLVPLSASYSAPVIVDRWKCIKCGYVVK